MTDLSKRDKISLIAGGLALLAWGLAELVFLPAVEKKQVLTRVHRDRQQQLVEMARLIRRFKNSARQGDLNETRLKKRGPRFSLFSFLDQQVRQAGLKKNVTFMKPGSLDIDHTTYRKDTVKIKFNNLVLKELVDFLYRVESSDNLVQIHALSLTRTGKKDHLLDAVIETHTPMPKEPG